MNEFAICMECGERITDLSEQALGSWKSFNQLLMQRGERPLGPDEVAVCIPGCIDTWRAKRKKEGLLRQQRAWAREGEEARRKREAEFHGRETTEIPKRRR